MLNIPVFRQHVKTAEGIRTSPDYAKKYEHFHYSLNILGRTTKFQDRYYLRVCNKASHWGCGERYELESNHHITKFVNYHNDSNLGA